MVLVTFSPEISCGSENIIPSKLPFAFWSFGHKTSVEKDLKSVDKNNKTMNTA